MEMFKFTRASDVPQAVQLGARSTTAQQGAEVRFVAGGTTLLDLMKLDVVTRRRTEDWCAGAKRRFGASSAGEE
jgi:xanthine dehydrogenase YagS FAD-binding subunit